MDLLPATISMDISYHHRFCWFVFQPIALAIYQNFKVRRHIDRQLYSLRSITIGIFHYVVSTIHNLNISHKHPSNSS
jgi:hypothetical protein